MGIPCGSFEALMGVRGGVMGGVPHGVRRDGEDIGVSNGVSVSCGDGHPVDWVLLGASFSFSSEES